MTLTPRKVRLALALLFACGAGAQARAAAAQAKTPPGTPAASRARAPQTAKPSDKPARDAKARDRRERQAAASALNEAASAAGGVEDSYKRALILSRAAEALWLYDEQSARALVSRAWDAAVASDEAEARSLEEGYREEAAAKSPPESADDLPEEFTRVTRAREEVLSAVSRHDARLTERYLAEITGSIKARLGAGDGDPSHADARAASYEYDELMRLDISESLAEEGDYAQAAQVASRGVERGVSVALVRFLIQFRASATAEADALYRRLLARTAADPSADVNDVLLLSSYTLTPALLASFDGGSAHFRPVQQTQPPEPAAGAPLTAALMRDFFEVTAGILMRPQRGTGRHADAAALYFTVTRLLPYFERGAPQLAPQLQARRQTLAAELDAQSREWLSNSAGTKSLSPSNPVDPLAGDFEYARTGPSPTARDAARSRAVERAVALKLWERARAAAEAMENAESRAGYLRLIAVAQVASAADAFEDEEDGHERAALFVQNADVPPLTRAYGYSRAAVLASKRNKPARARELLDRAQSFAEQTDSGTEARFYAMLVTAAAAEEFDAARAWAAVPALVRAANEVRDAERDGLGGGLREPHVEGVENVGLGKTLADFRLGALFASLAKRDFERALREARALDDAATRSLVLVSAARARLAAPPTPEAKGAR